MSQMVRAQLIFDRCMLASGMPASRDADGEVAPLRIETDERERAVLATEPTEVVVPFAQELAQRLQLARERVEAEQVHLAEVGTVAAAYLGCPPLRLVK